MSADDYFLIRKHPAGGFAAVRGFESSDYTPEASPDHRSFPSVNAALDWVDDLDWPDSPEYGCRIHRECRAIDAI